jgi:hypothetical protein
MDCLRVEERVTGARRSQSTFEIGAGLILGERPKDGD